MSVAIEIEMRIVTALGKDIYYLVRFVLSLEKTHPNTHNTRTHRHTHSLRNNCASRIRLPEFQFIAWPEAKAESGDKAIWAKEAKDKIKQQHRESTNRIRDTLN